MTRASPDARPRGAAPEDGFAEQGSASSRTYASLRRDIVSGGLAADRLLLEGALAERYGVSRTPVREALQRLEQDGLVLRATRGYAIRRYTSDEVFEIYEARILLEGHAAASAATRHGDADAHRIRLAHDRLVLLPTDSPALVRVDANGRFHRAIWEAGRNRAVLDLLERLQLHLVRHTTLLDPDRWSRVADEHGALVEAILAREPEQARQLMADHLASGRNLTLAALPDESSRG
jgi:DNA-binding GntR family transcriptional regulator